MKPVRLSTLHSQVLALPDEMDRLELMREIVLLPPSPAVFNMMALGLWLAAHTNEVIEALDALGVIPANEQARESLKSLREVLNGN